MTPHPYSDDLTPPIGDEAVIVSGFSMGFTSMFVRGITPVLAAMLLNSAAATPTLEPEGPDSLGTIPWTKIGTTASAQYSGDGLKVIQTEQGARLHCVFQRLEGEATREGLWLTSTVTNQARDHFRVTVAAIGGQVLPRQGEIVVDGQIVRFSRPGLIEEYSVSMDGVRQDFVVLEKPVPTFNSQSITMNSPSSELRIELEVTGAQVEQTAYGAQLVLESGRKISYSRLRVTDANGKELRARIEVPNNSVLGTPRSAITMRVLVDDSHTVYPIRIDPTFSDANWVSMNPSIPGTDGIIRAAVVDASGNLYVGGQFKTIGNVVASRIAKWDGSSWSALGRGVGDDVYALAVSGNDLYAGGDFGTAGGWVVNHVAKWDGTNWNALGSGFNSTVRALAVMGGKVYAGGDFRYSGGPAPMTTFNYIARWEGSYWRNFSYFTETGMNNPVYALAVLGTNVYAGGSFTKAPGSFSAGVSRCDGEYWYTLGSGVSGSFSSAAVYALAVSGSNLYAGGDFTIADGNAASRIAKWNGSAWSALGSGMSTTVRALAVSGTNVFAGGDSTGIPFPPIARISKWNGSTWTNLGVGVMRDIFSPAVYALAVMGNDLYAGGWFAAADSSPANYLAKWNGSAWSGIESQINNRVSVLAVSGNEVYAGGYFSAVGGGAANYIAKWTGSNWNALGLGMNDVVFALTAVGSNLYAGGNFTRATNNGGAAITANRIARWDGSAWSALGSGMNNYVRSLALAGTNLLYAGGGFTNAGGSAANCIAKWDGTNWSGLGAGLNNTVDALALASGNVYAGGRFTNAGGSTANYIAKWDGSNWGALGSGMNDDVRTLAAFGSDLYAGGAFTNAGGIAANYIAKWNGSTWSTLGSGMDSYVYCLAALGSDVYAGGNFTRATNNGGVAITVNRIAKWNGGAWSALGSGVNGTVFTLAVSWSDVYAGGDFMMAGGKISGYAAKWAPLAFRANSVIVSNETFQALLTGPDTNSVVVDGTTNFTNWTPVVTNTLPPGGAWQLTLPTGTNSHQFYRARLGP